MNGICERYTEGPHVFLTLLEEKTISPSSVQSKVSDYNKN